MPRAWDVLQQITTIPPGTLLPMLAAVLLQVSFYLAAATPRFRLGLESRFSPAALAGLAVTAALVPYLTYALPTDVFQLAGFTKLAVISAVPALVFVIWPVKEHKLSWQDVVVLGAIGTAELGKFYRQIYASPVEDLRLDFLGRFMMITVAATAFLSIRRLSGVGFRLGMSWSDWKTGIRQALMFLPLGIGIGVVIGFAGYRPVDVDAWLYPVLVALTFFGMYAFVALFEELLFRGVLQNLLEPTLANPVGAQIVTSIAFGLIHLPFRAFPNWRFAIVGAIAGWFYGQAYRDRRNVVAASIAHALVVTIWRLLFTG